MLRERRPSSPNHARSWHPSVAGPSTWGAWPTPASNMGGGGGALLAILPLGLAAAANAARAGPTPTMRPPPCTRLQDYSGTTWHGCSDSLLRPCARKPLPNKELGDKLIPSGDVWNGGPDGKLENNCHPEALRERSSLALAPERQNRGQCAPMRASHCGPGAALAADMGRERQPLATRPPASEDDRMTAVGRRCNEHGPQGADSVCSETRDAQMGGGLTSTPPEPPAPGGGTRGAEVSSLASANAGGDEVVEPIAMSDA